MNVSNHAIRLAARPAGLPTKSDFTYTEEAMPEPAEGEMLVKVSVLALGED
jgi:NADPH-dependent curcumin reductase